MKREKVFNFGECCSEDEKARITICIEEEALEKGIEFRATGDIKFIGNGGGEVGGQCFQEMFPFLKNNAVYREIFYLWKKFHLNGLHAGTPEQEAAIEEWKSMGNTFNYTKVCDFLKEKDLYEVNVDGEPYCYGEKWLFQEIPDEDLKRIDYLFESVPEKIKKDVDSF